MKVKEIFKDYETFKNAVREDISDIIINAKKFNDVIIRWCDNAWRYNYEYYNVIDTIIIIINSQRHYK